MLQPKQGYISKELTHFVASSLRDTPDDYETLQYEVLIEILKSGQLIQPNSPFKNGSGYFVSARKLSDNAMYNPKIVCFCDIPVECLPIHINKYSRFGLSFSKDFIAMQGGKPVYYVPKFGSHLSSQPDQSNSTYFDEMANHFRNVFALLSFEVARLHHSHVHKLPPLNLNATDAPRTLNDVLQDFPSVFNVLDNFFSEDFFCYIKFFDHNLDDTDPDNFYFEREWRVIGDVRFDLKDVKRVLLPEQFTKNFRNDLPKFYGEITPIKQ